MKYKVGDSLKIITDMFEGIGVYKGATILVVQECETEGQWLDRRGVEVEALNTFANGKYFELVEEKKVKNKFAVGDRVISIKNTPEVPEGWIGYITNKESSGYDYVCCKPGDLCNLERFQEDELELLAVSKDPDWRNRDDITPQDIAGIVKPDVINSPKHYMLTDGFEVKDLMKLLLNRIENSDTGFSHFQSSCYKEAMQYFLRFMLKNGLEDLQKGRYYIDEVIKEWEGK